MSSPQTFVAWIPTLNTFGARLAVVRQRMGWGNVKEAAVACGVPAASWRSWERDGVSPRRIVDIAQGIAQRTGVDYVWLLTGQQPENDRGPRPDGPDGGLEEVRHQGLEPRTRWFEAIDDHAADVLPFGRPGLPPIQEPREVAA